MSFLLNMLLVVGVFYLAGRIMFAHNERKHLSVVHVMVSFLGIMVVNALIMSLLLVVFFVVGAAIIALSGSESGLLFDSAGRLDASNMLVIIFVLIFATAFIHYALRRPLLKRNPPFCLSADEYQIFEYFIQWVTIYLVVYQCFFDGFRSLAAWSELGETTLQSIFEVALTPTNLNLVVQPLLISSWVLVVLERFARQDDPEDSGLLSATPLELEALKIGHIEVGIPGAQARIQAAGNGLGVDVSADKNQLGHAVSALRVPVLGQLRLLRQ